MIEREMEELLWNYPEKFFHEPLKQFSRQQRSAVGRSDLIFTDRLGRLLIVEIKKGKLERGAVGQVVDYFGMIKNQFPDKPVEMMLVANLIPDERRLACQQYDIEPREISEKHFRDVAAEVGYQFQCEATIADKVEASPQLVRRAQATKPLVGGRLLAHYEVRPEMNVSELENLIASFEAVVKRRIDRSLALNLRNDLLNQHPPRIALKTLQQLARWCNTNNPVYWDGMDVAKKISLLLFGRVVDRNDLGT